MLAKTDVCIGLDISSAFSKGNRVRACAHFSDRIEIVNSESILSRAWIAKINRVHAKKRPGWKPILSGSKPGTVKTLE